MTPRTHRVPYAEGSAAPGGSCWRALRAASVCGWLGPRVASLIWRARSSWVRAPCRSPRAHQAEVAARSGQTVFADLIDGPLAHLPSGHFGVNSAWALCAAIAHNLLRAESTPAGGHHARARGATLRRRIIAVPARLPPGPTRPPRRPAPPRQMALDTRMAAAMGPSPRPHQPPRDPTPANTDPSETISGTAGQTSGITAPQGRQGSNSMIHSRPRS